MQKFIKITSISIGIIFGVYLVLKTVGLLQTYKAESTSSAPVIMPGDWIFATNLIDPKQLDHICFEQTNPAFPLGIWIQRLVAKERDKLEIVDGVLFVNDKNQDEVLTTMHSYWVDSEALAEMERTNVSKTFSDAMAFRDSSLVEIEDKKVLPYMNARKNDYLDMSFPLFKAFNINWTKNNFGPIIIPKGKVFLLGDNRDASIDSRYLGFIGLAEIVGVRF